MAWRARVVIPVLSCSPAGDALGYGQQLERRGKLAISDCQGEWAGREALLASHAAHHSLRK
ncbi:MAG: hypothetical protein DMG51_03385 [Acidobacteria bacterium]|nr:MAG: hypothetical protein DMG51_03385 [Acidobacteriota bacterium]